MLITPEYCRMMARYNAWQNGQIKAVCETMTEADLHADRGAFFGSVLGTLNHLLWGDLLWMSRFDGGVAPEGGIAESTGLCPTLAVWSAERFRADGRIRLWADALHAVDLTGDMTWFSGAQGREVCVPVAQAVVHLFNHQTHHRGQVHGMLTAAGRKTGGTDLVFMPKEHTWL